MKLDVRLSIVTVSPTLYSDSDVKRMPSIAEPYTPGCIYAGDAVEDGRAEGGSRHRVAVGAVKFRKWTRKQGRPVSTTGLPALSA